MRIERVLETSLYADDLEAAERFYTALLGVEPFMRVAGRHVFYRLREQILLIFRPEATATAAGGGVPPHGARGPGHAGFAVGAAEVDAWRARLAALGIAIEHEQEWPRGGRSLYFRDPAGNSLELVPPGIWGLPE